MTEADAKLIENVRKWLAAYDASNYYASAILSQCPEDVSRAFVRCADEASAQSAEIARLRAMIRQIICVCEDNTNAKHIEMAMDFVEQVARAALETKG